MNVSTHKQGSDEWFAERLGIPTASMYSKIITSTGTPSASASTLMNELLAEWYVGKTVDQWEGNDWTIRGNELEPEARKLYSFITGNDVEEVGFCTMPGILTGASPDGLVSDSGLVEIKCPKASTMIKYMLANKLPTTYKQQVHGQLWVTGRKWCDFMAHHPDFEPFIIHVKRDKRDDEYIKKLEASVLLFIKKMLVKRDELDKLRA